MKSDKPSNDYNPYQAPETIVHDSHSEIGGLLDTPVSLPAGSGMDWLKHAWSIFMARPLLWVGFTIFYIIALVALLLIPIVGFLAGFLATFIIAGVAYVAYQIDMDKPVSFGDFFMGFQHNVGQQILLIILNFVACFLFAVAFALVAMVFGVGIGTLTGSAQDGAALGLALFGLVALFFYIPLVMCMYFAPILILFHDVPAFSAMKLSFIACLKNFFPFLILGIILMIAAVIAIIPLGLGLLVFTPVTMITSYAAYREMLTAQS